MTIHKDNESEYQFSFDWESIAEQVVEQTLDELDCPYDVDVNLSLVTEEEIQSANKEFREIDRVTDVLSFPLNDFDEPGIFDEEALIAQDGFHPETGELMLGDIVICVPRMREQAVEYGHGELREFGFLIAHSMLHLCGFDHMTEEEAKIMEAKQESILNALQITR